MASSNPPAKHVLVAEDDRAMRDLIVQTLQQSDFLVAPVDDGEALIEHICTHRRPDAIVSDVNMPGMNGLEALGLIRLLVPTTPVVLITAFGDRRVRRRASQLGAHAVLDKPFPCQRLRELIVDLANERPPTTGA